MRRGSRQHVMAHIEPRVFFVTRHEGILPLMSEKPLLPPSLFLQFRVAVACVLCVASLLARAGESKLPPAGPMPYPAVEAPDLRLDDTGKIIRVPEDQRSVQDAIDAAKDGDTVLLAPGRYPGGLRIGGKAITLASQYLTTGDARMIEKTIIDAAGKAAGIHVTNMCKPATRIIGLTLRGGSDGIMCYARCSIMHNCIVGAGDGIDYEGGGGVCMNNVFEDCRDDAIDLDGDCAVRIENNVLRDSHDDGIEIRFYPYDGEKILDILIRHNLIIGSGEDGIQIIDHPGRSNRRLWIERNIIRRTAKAAIGFMDNSDTREDYRAAQVSDPIYLVNNTFLDNNWGMTGGANVVAVNNVFADTKHTAVFRCAGQSLFSHNLFWQNGGDWKESNVLAAGAIVRDPKLDGDAVPVAGSPCIDGGMAVVSRDQSMLFEIPRDTYVGKAPDLGAKEGTSH